MFEDRSPLERAAVIGDAVDVLWSAFAGGHPELEYVGDIVAPLEQAQAALCRAEAARIQELVTAYRNAMDEVAESRGERHAGRLGVAARSFVLQAALAMNMTERGSAHLLDTAHGMIEDLPKTWEVFQRGEIPWRAIETAFRQAEGLTVDRIGEYDEATARVIAATPLPRLNDKLHRLRERIQADTAVRRSRRAADGRHKEIEPRADGQAALTLIGPAAKLVGIDEAIFRAAVAAHGVEGETRSVGQLCFDIAVDLLTEGIKAAADPDRPVGVPQRKGVTPVVYVTIPVLTMPVEPNDAPEPVPAELLRPEPPPDDEPCPF